MTPHVAPESHQDCAEYRRLWQRPVSRRDMLAGTFGVVALGATGGHLLLDHSVLNHLGRVQPGAAPPDNILIVIQQAGGNDGLNTVVPYTDPTYYKRRPTLAVPAHRVLPLNSTHGLHPNLSGIRQIWSEGNLAVINGVGYPNPDLSHFKSTLIWQTGDAAGAADSGWLGRYLDTTQSDNANPLKAISIGDTLPIAFRSRANATPAVTSLPDFQLVTDSDGKARRATLQAFREMNAASDINPTYAAIRSSQTTTIRAVGALQSIPTGYHSRVRYPKSDLARQLQLVAQLIHANLGTRIFWVMQDGYDDHVREAGDHAHLLAELDGAVSSFYRDMRARNWHRRVMLMTWSEFGRRVEENGDKGTDHGTSAPMFMLGGAVRGGTYGDDPMLRNLDADGNLKYHIDFRSVYGSVIEHWMHGDSGSVIGNGYGTVPFV